MNFFLVFPEIFFIRGAKRMKKNGLAKMRLEWAAAALRRIRFFLFFPQIPIFHQ
jgi:hypothetical protein